MATPKKDSSKKASYSDLQKLMVQMMDLRIGDTVVPSRDWEAGELGYTHEYEGHDLGEYLQVKELDNDSIRLSNREWYPIFVLQKRSDLIKINDDYDAEIQEDGSVNVGCVEVPFDLLEHIYEAAKAKNDEYL